jgi:signal transduction histidine kinase
MDRKEFIKNEIDKISETSDVFEEMHPISTIENLLNIEFIKDDLVILIKLFEEYLKHSNYRASKRILLLLRLGKFDKEYHSVGKTDSGYIIIEEGSDITRKLNKALLDHFSTLLNKDDYKNFDKYLELLQKRCPFEIEHDLSSRNPEIKYRIDVIRYDEIIDILTQKDKFLWIFITYAKKGALEQAIILIENNYRNMSLTELKEVEKLCDQILNEAFHMTRNYHTLKKKVNALCFKMFPYNYHLDEIISRRTSDCNYDLLPTFEYLYLESRETFIKFIEEFPIKYDDYRFVFSAALRFFLSKNEFKICNYIYKYIEKSIPDFIKLSNKIDEHGKLIYNRDSLIFKYLRSIYLYQISNSNADNMLIKYHKEIQLEEFYCTLYYYLINLDREKRIKIIELINTDIKKLLEIQNDGSNFLLNWIINSAIKLDVIKSIDLRYFMNKLIYQVYYIGSNEHEVNNLYTKIIVNARKQYEIPVVYSYILHDYGLDESSRSEIPMMVTFLIKGLFGEEPFSKDYCHIFHHIKVFVDYNKPDIKTKSVAETVYCSTQLEEAIKLKSIYNSLKIMLSEEFDNLDILEDIINNTVDYHVRKQERDYAEKLAQVRINEQKRMMSFLTHTLRNTLSSGPETAKTITENLISIIGDKYNQNKKASKTINKAASLLTTFHYVDNLIDTFKLFSSDKETIEGKWKKEVEGDMSVSSLIDRSIMQIISKMLYNSSFLEERKKLFDFANIKDIKKSFLDIVISETESAVQEEKLAKWLNDNCPKVKIDVDSIAYKIKTEGFRFGVLFSIITELFSNSISYDNGEENISVKVRNKNGNVEITITNKHNKGEEITSKGTNKGIEFIEHIVKMIDSLDIKISDSEEKWTSTLLIKTD